MSRTISGILQWLPIDLERELQALVGDVEEFASGGADQSSSERRAVAWKSVTRPYQSHKPSINDDARKKGGQKSHKGVSRSHKKYSDGLRGEPNESILNAVETLLSKPNLNLGEAFDEDQVLRHMLRMNRHATQQAKHHTFFMVDNSMHADETHASDRNSLYLRLLDQEERHATGQVFFRGLLGKFHKFLNHESSLDDTDLTKSPDLLDPTFQHLTFDWLRRKIGLHRHYTYNQNQRAVAEFSVFEGGTEDGCKLESNWYGAQPSYGRRLTRGMVQSTQVQRREKDLRILIDAIDTLQTDLGPAFARRRTAASHSTRPELQKSRKRKLASTQDILEQTPTSAESNKNGKQMVNTGQTLKIALIRQIHLLIFFKFR
jgi:hypothetical protein